MHSHFRIVSQGALIIGIPQTSLRQFPSGIPEIPQLFLKYRSVSIHLQIQSDAVCKDTISFKRPCLFSPDICTLLQPKSGVPPFRYLHRNPSNCPSKEHDRHINLIGIFRPATSETLQSDRRFRQFPVP
jgi:hypothetical protein